MIERLNPFKVWAPKAAQVDLQIGNEKVPMEFTERGWWSAALGSLETSSDYGYWVDGQGPYPDPRSPWQPTGVHGLSHQVDHRAFRWADRSWQAKPLDQAVIYELHIGTFTPQGTFEAAISRLDALVDLGVTHIELMPVAEFPGDRGWGYDGVDLYAPHHTYGGPLGLKRLVDACHAKGLAVILDVVYNHLGPEGNYLSIFGPYYEERYATPWGEAMNFDGPGSDEVRLFFIDNAVSWVEHYHVDGLRLDAVHAMIDQSAQHFLERLALEVHARSALLRRRVVLIAESDLNQPRLVQSAEIGGYGLDAQWSDDFHHALHAVLSGERSGYYQDFGDLADLAKALQDAYVYDGRYSTFRGRRHGRPVSGIPAERFLGYLQNHDQIGNRAEGERISHLIGTDLFKVGSAILLLAPFTPLIFEGQEWGASTPFLFFSDFQDPQLAQVVSEGRKREFAGFVEDPDLVPDPQALQTFLRSKLIWDEAAREPHRSILNWYRQLISLRRGLPPVTIGSGERMPVWFNEHAGWIAFQRGKLLVVGNLTEQDQEIELKGITGDEQVLLASSAAPHTEPGRIWLPAVSIVVFQNQ